MAIINTCAKFSYLTTYSVFFTEKKWGATLALLYLQHFRSKPIDLSDYVF